MVNAGVVALAGVLVLGGCSDGGGDDSGSSGAQPWMSADATWMQPAGTPLADGLVVPEGAQLVGPVFSHLDNASHVVRHEGTVERQSAFLDAADDIAGMANGLAQQVDDTKFKFQYNDSLCNQRIDSETMTDFKAYTGGEPDADASALLCGGYQPVAGGIEIDLQQDLTSAGQPVRGRLIWGRSLVAVPSSLPEAPADVVGPPVVKSDVENEPDLNIVDGSFLAGPAGYGYGTGGFTAVIGVTGNPDDVFDEYMAYQMKNPPPAEDQTIGGLRIRQGTTGGAGGVTYTVTLNEIDGNAWILVEAYND